MERQYEIGLLSQMEEGDKVRKQLYRKGELR